MRLFCLAAVVLCVACPVPPAVTDAGGGRPDGEGEGEEGDEGEGEGGVGCVSDDDTGFDLPITNRTAAVGSAATLDIAAWNLAHFGNSGAREVSLVADVIESLNVDLMAVEEVESPTDFAELAKRLPDHEGILEREQSDDPQFDQRVGVLYRCGRLTPLGNPVHLFSGNGNFPREPLQVTFRFDDGDAVFDFTAIVVHFKAFEDQESRDRREQAFILLQNYVDSFVNSAAGTENVVVLGDFNERLDEPAGAANWGPFLDTSKYVVRTQPLVDRGEASFINNDDDTILDHIVTTRAFDDEAGAATIVIPRVDEDVPNYRSDVSDHRPVALVLRGF